MNLAPALRSAGKGRHEYQALKDALRKLESLSDSDQEELAKALQRMVLRKRIDAKLTKAKARGGKTPHEEVVAASKRRNAG
jgi:tellurite resistance protein